MTKPRQKSPTIRIGGQVRAMTGNARDGYWLRIDELFMARVKCSALTCGTVAMIRCGKLEIMCREVKGYHEQAAANAISRWFERRARLWLGGTDARRAVS